MRWASNGARPRLAIGRWSPIAALLAASGLAACGGSTPTHRAIRTAETLSAKEIEALLAEPARASN